MDLESTVRAAAGGDLDAFAEIVRRFQHMAFGYALSFVRDLGQAITLIPVSTSCVRSSAAAPWPSPVSCARERRS